MVPMVIPCSLDLLIHLTFLVGAISKAFFCFLRLFGGFPSCLPAPFDHPPTSSVWAQECGNEPFRNPPVALLIFGYIPFLLPYSQRSQQFLSLLRNSGHSISHLLRICSGHSIFSFFFDQGFGTPRFKLKLVPLS